MLKNNYRLAAYIIKYIGNDNKQHQKTIYSYSKDYALQMFQRRNYKRFISIRGKDES